MWGESQLAFWREGRNGFHINITQNLLTVHFSASWKTGWLFVTGVGANNNFRHTFFDDSPDAARMHEQWKTLDSKFSRFEDANHRVKADGVTLFSITGRRKASGYGFGPNNRIKRKAGYGKCAFSQNS